MFFIIRKGLKNFSDEEKRKLVVKIIDNDFLTVFNLIMIIRDLKKLYLINNKDVKELVNSDISLRKKIKRGISSKTFINNVGEKVGYRLFESNKRKNHFIGNIVIDDKKHGIYFTIDEREVFRFFMCASSEDLGDSIAEISFRNKNGKLIKNAHIAKGCDSKGTYRAHRFYVKDVYSLNDYDFVNHLYEVAYPVFQNLIYDDSKYGMYRKNIKYFEEKGMHETVRALQDIHKKEVRKFSL